MRPTRNKRGGPPSGGVGDRWRFSLFDIVFIYRYMYIYMIEIPCWQVILSTREDVLGLPQVRRRCFHTTTTHLLKKASKLEPENSFIPPRFLF